MNWLTWRLLWSAARVRLRPVRRVVHGGRIPEEGVANAGPDTDRLTIPRRAGLAHGQIRRFSVYVKVGIVFDELGNRLR